VTEPSVVVTFESPPELRAAIDGPLDGLAVITYLSDAGDRAAALSGADAVLAFRLDSELSEAELRLLGSAGLVQIFSAGVEHVPFAQLPADVPVAANAGAYAEPIAEHVLALASALSKRILQNQAALARGVFDQETLNRELHGAVVTILGYGGIGRASARLFEAFAAEIRAIGRAATPDERDGALAATDVLVIAAPLTRITRGLIGQRELKLMKPDAILINVARAEIVDQDALFEHLRDTPAFSAGLDVWWQEPEPGDLFTTRRPFFELPNVLGSPHNSGITAGTLAGAARDAAANIARQLRGEPVLHLVNRSDYGEDDGPG
jgi:phosphoglycerate dehydrogenase-like enzyme